VKTSKALGAPITPAQAEKHVRTFHSKLLRLTSSIQPSGTDVLEWLGKVRRPRAGSPEEEEFERQREELADQVDNPYNNKLSASQADVLRTVFVEAYKADERFREAICALLQHSLRDELWQEGAWVDEDWNRRQWAHDRDEALTEHVEQHWIREGRWPIDGVVKPPRQLEVENLRFRAHGYLLTSGVHVVLAGNDLSKDYVYEKGRKFKPFHSSNSKRNVLLRGCRDAIFFVRSRFDLKELEDAIEAEEAIGKGTAPVFKCRLPGDGGSSKPIAEALYGLGTFMENLGLRPADDAIPLSKRLKPLDSLTLYAVGRLFQCFEEYKQANALCTFNDLFFLLQEGSPSLRSLPLEQLRSIKHLLVDEFQDISPLVVGMIKGLHGELLRRQGVEQGRPTLLVVGDDWQSIYGWRGSAPRFFIEFAESFSGAAPKPIRLTDNWRSTQKIVECAANVLKPVSAKHKVEKLCRAISKDVSALPIPVYLVEEELQDENVGKVVRALAELRTGDEELLIVGRTKKVLGPAEDALPKGRSDKINVMSVHKSKGLEADYVLILGDCAYPYSSPIKNALYERAGFTQSFDDSQRDEACRLAYVALTRAKKLCIWMGEPADGGAMQSIPQRHPSCRRGDVELVLSEIRRSAELIAERQRTESEMYTHDI
jgi:hypothetical protein